MCIFFVPSDTAYWKQFLSRYARTNFPIFPRSYFHPMQPILQFARNYLRKNGLHLIIVLK